MIRIVCTGAALAFGAGAPAAVLFDYGPSKLGVFGGCWFSVAHSDNFTEDYTNLSGSTVQVDKLSVWTCNPGFEGLTYSVKVVQDTDADGVPDGYVLEPFEVPAVPAFEGTFGGQDVWRYDLSFPAISQPNGMMYSWGAACVGVDTGQLSIHAPGNGEMWQYHGAALPAVSVTVGDMMIRLEGTVPAPGAIAPLGLIGLAAARRRRVWRGEWHRMWS